MNPWTKLNALDGGKIGFEVAGLGTADKPPPLLLPHSLENLRARLELSFCQHRLMQTGTHPQVQPRGEV